MKERDHTPAPKKGHSAKSTPNKVVNSATTPNLQDKENNGQLQCFNGHGKAPTRAEESLNTPDFGVVKPISEDAESKVNLDTLSAEDMNLNALMDGFKETEKEAAKVADVDAVADGGTVKTKEMSAAQLLEYCRISPTEHISPPEIAWMQTGGNNAIFGTLGNFSLVIGKAKSKKSFLLTAVISTALSGRVILNNIIGRLKHDKRKVLFFDTEQSKYHVQQSIRRICKQTGVENPENLEAYGLRPLNYSERLKAIEQAIHKTENLGMVVIDGIRDLVTSINDEEQATILTSKLLKWTEEKGIHIIVVLHQNKGDNNARGHLGTELINKAETVLAVTRVEHNNNISIVEPQQCRNREPEVFGFEIIDGLPIAAEEGLYAVTTKGRKPNPLENMSYENKVTVLDEVYSHGDSFGHGQLLVQIKLAVKEKLRVEVGNNKVIAFITELSNDGFKRKTEANITEKIHKYSVQFRVKV